jgi:hypothetical protein
MTDDRSLERAARSWIEVGPTSAPEAAIEAALARIQTTPQERDLRIPWRFSDMSLPLRLAAAVVVVALAAGGVMLILRPPGQPAVGGPSPSPSTTSSQPAPSSSPVVPSSLLAPFSSAVYPYSIEIPSNWKIRNSEREITATEFPYDYDVGVDYFSATAPTIGDPAMIGAAPIVDGGTTLDGWIGSIDTLQGCGTPDGSEAVQLDGRAGRLLTWKACPVFLLWATVLQSNRAYDVIWIDEFADGNPTLQAADKARFQAALATFKFTGAAPESSASPAASSSAAAVPAFTRTFTSPRMGFSIHYPDRWSAHPATESWVAGETISRGGGTYDDLRGADARLSVASQPLKAGDTPAKRLAAMVAASPSCTPVRPAPSTILVGGEPGTVAVNGCVNLGAGGMIPGGRAYVVLLVVGGRAYDFILDGAVDPEYLASMLATVTFDPASAIDP